MGLVLTLFKGTGLLATRKVSLLSITLPQHRYGIYWFEGKRHAKRSKWRGIVHEAAKRGGHRDFVQTECML